ncbi:MAG: ATP-dependent metallopeptidase FtsH/Yme1/Tma family protein [Campylobacterota bacterium]|nr:ATP-dependent metallopeptidase FtsH/Yme1/Tma family protein [Campylobacterota bacterium]
MLNSKKNRLILYASAFIVIALILFAILRDSSSTISLQETRSLIASKMVEKVVFANEFLYFYSTDGNIYKIPRSQISSKELQNVKVEVSHSSQIITTLLILVLFLGLGSLLYRWWQKRITPISQTANQSAMPQLEEALESITPSRSNVTFSDIGGVSEVKEELEEIIDFLKNPKRYHNFGARMPRGVLLIGPPGVGKTMIAKAVASEAEVPFFYQSGASFVQIYVGMGAKRVHELFNAAKKSAPSIIFIDEIDAVGKKRDGTRNDEREATLNQLLTEMDGFEESSGVVVVAATNNIEVMDAALLRAGRFDRRIFVEVPTPKEREAIVGKYLKHIPHNVKLEDIGVMSTGFSGAALAAFVNEAALLSLRQKDLHVSMEHFLAVKEKVMFGKRRIPLLNQEQKRYRARYQAGKALVATWFDMPFEKISLTSDTMQPPISQPLLQHEIVARIQMYLAGMAASNLAFNEHASNAAADISEARQLVTQMIDTYAMGSSLIPEVSEKSAMLDTLYSETKKLLSGKEELLVNIETVLMEYESISKELIKKMISEVL